MTIRQFVFHIAGMASAYATVLLIPVFFNFIYNTFLELCVIVWLNLGLFVMQAKKIRFPEPATDRIDTRGGIRVLWWAAFWPRYLSSSK